MPLPTSSVSIPAVDGSGLGYYSGSFAVNSPVGCTWIASVISTSPIELEDFVGTEDGSVTYEVPDNAGAARNMTISVNGQTFTVYQAAGTPSSPGGTLSTSTDNVMTFQVSQSALCNTLTINQPCTSVTICTGNHTSTSQCQTISDILVDTGSYGLRIFSSAVGIGMSQVTDNSSSPLAECSEFGTGEAWGPVVSADLQLAGEPIIRSIPIQLVESTYNGGPPLGSACEEFLSDLMTSPQQAGYNGILGIGLPKYDEAGVYYPYVNPSPSPSPETPGSTVALSNLVTNPVSMFPVDSNGVADNNGIVFSLAGISSSGATAVNGAVTFGIGTKADNNPTTSGTGAVTSYVADPTDYSFNIKTTFSGSDYDSFLDSGSNGLFFPIPSGFTDCDPGDEDYWYCPTLTTQYVATNYSPIGSTTGTASFWIANASNLFELGYFAFNDLGADSSNMAAPLSTEFDWGIPFFYGKTIYIGVYGAYSTLSAGSGCTADDPSGCQALWAY